MLPWNLSQDRHGVFQRMGLMLEAAKGAFGAVTVLLVVPIGTRPEPDYLEKLENIRRWMAADLGQGFKVELLAYEPAEPSWLAKLPRADWYFGPRPLPLASPGSVGRLDKIVADCRPVTIVAHRLLAFGLARQSSAARSIPIVLDLDDVEHVAHARQVLMPPVWRSKRLRLIHCASLLAEELRALARCRQVYLCSARDTRRFGWIDLGRRLRVVPNTIADPYGGCRPPQAPDAPRVLYVGALTYAPNRAGLQWFVESIWPQLLARSPGVRLTIVGQGSRDFSVPETVAESIDLLGFVEDLAPIYAASSVVVCPLLAGGGTRIKIIEAAAHGRPVVSTTIGAEGLDFVGGESIVLADSPGDFSRRLADILAASDDVRRIGSNARRVFLEKYERRMALDLLSGMLAQVASEATGPAS